MAASPPEYIYGSILPYNTLNILDLLKFPTPPLDTAPKLRSDDTIFSSRSSMIDSEVSVRALLKLPIPPLKDINHLLLRVETAIEKGLVSIDYEYNDGTNMKLPLWVLEYWKAIYDVVEAKTRWSSARNWLEQRAEGKQVIEMLSQLPWKYDLPRAMGGNSLSLACYASEEWLGSTHTVQISEVINAQMAAQGMGATWRALSQDFTDKLLVVFRYSKDTYHVERSCESLRKLGALLKTRQLTTFSMFVCVHVAGSKGVLACANVRGNHWTALIIDTTTHKMLYGDSLALSPPDELIAAVNWWLMVSLIDVPQYSVGDLPCARQEDDFSCLVLAANAINAYFFALDTDIARSKEETYDCRAEILEKSISLIKKYSLLTEPKDLAIIISNNSLPHKAPMPTSEGFIPIESTFAPKIASRKRHGSVGTGQASNTKRVKEEKPEKHRLPQTNKPVHPFFNVSAASVTISTTAKSVSAPTQSSLLAVPDDEWSDDDGDNDKNEEVHENPSELIDVDEPRKKKNGKDGGGRPRNNFLDRLVVRCYKESDPARKHLYRCVGE
ncbi:hypothetical protein H0H93_010349, partial [Arthromyces matolae]